MSLTPPPPTGKHYAKTAVPELLFFRVGNKKLPPPGTALNFSSSPHSLRAAAIDPRPSQEETPASTAPQTETPPSPPKQAIRGAGDGHQEHQRKEGWGSQSAGGRSLAGAPTDPRRQHTAPPSPLGPAGSHARPRRAEKGEKGEPPPTSPKSAAGGGGDPLPASPQRGFCPPCPPRPQRIAPCPPFPRPLPLPPRTQRAGGAAFPPGFAPQDGAGRPPYPP